MRASDLCGACLAVWLGVIAVAAVLGSVAILAAILGTIAGGMGL